MSFQPTVFGRYQLLEPIAKGGMAEVFKARLVAAAGTEKLVCIKRILPHLLTNKDFLTLFVQEAKIALPLTHGNITQVFDFGTEEGVYFLAMEYIPGQNLHSVLKRVGETGGKLDLGDSLYIAQEVCKGLQFAHSYRDAKGKTQAVVHRDVTPHNILISYNGDVKLTDFGIALAATKVTPSDGGVIRGKPCYLSPEQADGHSGEPRSDIFSLGTVLYEMLTGTRLFEADSEPETLRRLRELEIPPPSKLNPQVSKELDVLVLKAMARDPQQRFSKAAEMQVALSHILHKQSAEYTASTLASAIKELFVWEISQAEQGDSSDETRDRLLFQLSRAGVKVDPDKTSTSDLLEMGTVAIAGAAPPKKPKKKNLHWIGAGVAALCGLVVGIIVLSSTDDGAKDPKQDSGQKIQALKYNTEHLVLPSMKTSVMPEEKGPADPKTKPTPRKTPRKVAYLNCNSWPWSVVFLNGRRLPGNTPLFRVKVAAGKHRLRFANPELGLSKEVTISVDPGNTKTVAVSLRQ